MEKKGRRIGGTAPPIFINLPLLFMFFCLFFCVFIVCFWMFSFFTFCVLCGCYDEGCGDGWDQDFFLGLFMFSFFVFIFFVCWLTFGVDVMTRDFQGWLRQGIFFFFFFFFPLVFSLKDDRLDIYHYYCYFSYVDIAEIEILSESEVTDKQKWCGDNTCRAERVDHPQDCRGHLKSIAGTANRV